MRIAYNEQIMLDVYNTLNIEIDHCISILENRRDYIKNLKKKSQWKGKGYDYCNTKFTNFSNNMIARFYAIKSKNSTISESLERYKKVNSDAINMLGNM